jgi:tetratricopeptide (TPR) repeat protein
LLRAAQRAHPGDVWVNFDLARYLQDASPPQPNEVIRFYSIAHALRPETGHRLAHALERVGRTDEAIALFDDLTRVRPEEGRHYLCLGIALKDKGQVRAARDALDHALPLLRDAIRRRPKNGVARSNLGLALWLRGDLDGAIAAYREAIQVSPNIVQPHTNLGRALAARGDLDGAAAAYREALLLKPDRADTYLQLGNVLYQKGDPDAAIAAYREALRLQPNVAETHFGLAGALVKKGDQEAAIAEYRETIRLRPNLANAHYGLGNVLRKKGDDESAIPAYRETIRLKPDMAEAHCNLGLCLKQTGRFAEALDSLRRGHALGSKRPDWRYPSAQWVREAEQQAALAERLPAVLKGDDKPNDAAEGLTFAQMCSGKGLHAVAARFWADALSADPKLAEDRRTQPRYDAACAAALAGTGKTRDDPPPDEAARAKLRALALDWLDAERAAWEKVLETAQPESRAAIAQTLAHWQQDPDLAGVREPEALGKLPAEERAAWGVLWEGVESMLAKVRGGRP